MSLNLNYQPTVVVETSGLTESDWLNYRRLGIGGSDVAAVMGFSPWRTTRDLYYDKCGIPNAVEDKPNWVTLEVGHLLEPLVAQIFARKTGLTVTNDTKMYRHPLYPFMLADLDFRVEDAEGKQGVLECKTSNLNSMDKWSNDGVPSYYEWQCRHYMAVMNLDFVYIACLFSNNENDFVIRRIDRDLDIEADMIEAERSFWEDFVQAHVEPEYTERGDLVLDSLRRHYGASNPATAAVTLSPSLMPALRRWVELREQKQQLDRNARAMSEELDRIIAPVLDELKSAGQGVCSAGGESYTVQWKTKTRTSINKDDLLRLKTNLPSVYDEYSSCSESRTPTVKKG